MAAFTLQEVEKATGGRLLYPVVDDAVFSQVETDTRAITAGALFVALRGETFDGHDYVLQAEK